MNQGNRLPFPDSVMLTGPINPNGGQNTNSGPMINPIRTEVKKNAPGSLVLPSLNEVIKHAPFTQDNQPPPPMYSPNNMMPYPKTAPFPPSPISPLQSPNGRGPVPPPPKQQMQPIGALHSLLNPLPPGGKQNLYIVNDRNQIEFERQAMSNYPPMPPPIPASIYPPVNTMHSSVQSYQEQVQEAKRISENLQANVRVYLDPNTKKRKTEQPQQPQQQQFAQDPNVNIGAERSAFSPLKKRETTPSPSVQTVTAVTTPTVPNTRSPPSEDMSPSDADGKRDDQSNFAHLLQNNFSGINLTNDSCAELLDIYRNFHKNENAKLTPPPPLSADKDKRDPGNK